MADERLEAIATKTDETHRMVLEMKTALTISLEGNAKDIQIHAERMQLFENEIWPSGESLSLKSRIGKLEDSLDIIKSVVWKLIGPGVVAALAWNSADAGKGFLF